MMVGTQVPLKLVRQLGPLGAMRSGNGCRMLGRKVCVPCERSCSDWMIECNGTPDNPQGDCAVYAG
jgi:hypothetical protein